MPSKHESGKTNNSLIQSGSSRPPCPYLPDIDRIWRAQDLQSFRQHRNSDFYQGALSYAQSLWLEEKPAQALLQINRAFLADLAGNENIFSELPSPYLAVRWILQQPQTDKQFLGNPVRHYQHLATRMSGPRKEIRTYRAWACFQLAESVLPTEQFSRDLEQVYKEKIIFPNLTEISNALDEHGWPSEADAFLEALEANSNS